MNFYFFFPSNPVVANSSETSNLSEKRTNLRVFTLTELKTATNNFCEDLKIGEDGFGSVYKGVIKSLKHPFHEIQVAVKLAKELLQRPKEWVAEINTLGVIQHPNIVKLIGYCVEHYEGESGAQVVLVYEYMVNGRLKDHLSAKSETPLSWNMRLKVAQGAACGLTYLHEAIKYQTIFKNFKSSNVLLDEHWNAKLSHFGMPRTLHSDEKHVNHITTKSAYVEYSGSEDMSLGHLTSKGDVWSYGIFLYELITGRFESETEHPLNDQMLLEWVKPYIGSKEPQQIVQIVDPRLEGNYPMSSVQKLCIIANKCLSANPKLRPKMSEVFEMVNQVIKVPTQEASGHGSPQVPHVTVNTNEAFVGPTDGEKTNENIKQEGQNSSMKAFVGPTKGEKTNENIKQEGQNSSMKAFVGPTKGEKTNENIKQEVQNSSMKAQPKPSNFWKSCYKKVFCVS